MKHEPSCGAASTRAGRGPRQLATALSIILIVLVGLRPLIQESFDTERLPLDMVLELPPISPVTTLCIDLVIIVLAAAAVVCHGWPRSDPSPSAGRTGLAAGLAICAAAAAISCVFASNHRLAINATFDWLCGPLLAITAALLLREAWQIHLMMAVIIAGGAASAVESYDQYWVTLPNTIEMYEQHRQAFWGGQPHGDEYQVPLLERRIYERAASAFFSLANVAGSYFVLVIFATLARAFAVSRADADVAQQPRPAGGSTPGALATSGGADRTRAAALLRKALLMVLAAVLAGALACTRSRGAAGALVIGLAAAAVGWLLRRVLVRHRRRCFAAGWGLVLLTGAAGLWYASAYGLPGGSLLYRWWYLQSSAAMAADHPWTGVGSAQYGRYYPRYKDIRIAEEITDPHNFLAHAAAEWGLPGLAGVVLMLAGGSWAVAGLRRSGNTNHDDQHAATRAAPAAALRARGVLLWGIFLLAAVFALRIWITGITDFTYVFATNTLVMFGWAAAFALAAGGANRLPHPGLMGVGLAACLIHNLICFSLFVPGSATTFFALLGTCVAVRSMQARRDGAAHAATRADQPEPPGNADLAPVSTPIWVANIQMARGRTPAEARATRPAAALPPAGSPRRALFGTVAALTVASVLFILFVRPPSAAWRLLQQARRQAAHAPHEALVTYGRAAAADPLDPTAAREALDLLRTLPPPAAPPGEGVALPWPLRLALQRDPENISVYRDAARLYYYYGAAHASPQALGRALEYAEQALARYPSNPDDHLRLAEIAAALHHFTGDAAAGDRARRAYDDALSLNAQRDPAEIRRYSEERIRRIQTQRDALTHAADQ